MSAAGVKTDLGKIDHQHLSNIIWFCRVFHDWDNVSGWQMTRNVIHYELHSRFDNVLLAWEPLPIPNEIELIKEYCCVDKDNNIVWNGNIIGSLSHIN